LQQQIDAYALSSALPPLRHSLLTWYLLFHSVCWLSLLLLLLLQAVVAVCLGQASGSQEQLTAAQQYFRVVGSSASECDTIPGRQAMASCFFLMKLYEDVLVFLNVSVLGICRAHNVWGRASFLLLLCEGCPASKEVCQARSAIQLARGCWCCFAALSGA
jgi:hypothetical protein